MATGTFTISGTTSGGPGGSIQLTLSTPVPTAVPNDQTVVLTTGANTITIGALTTWLAIVPPNAPVPSPNPPFAGTLTLKGVSGDTGIVISNKYPTVLEWDLTGSTSPASIVVNASTGCTINVVSS